MRSSPVRLRVKPAPKIKAVTPQALPAGTPTTSHHVRLLLQDDLDPLVHAVRVGENELLSLLQVDEEGFLSFEAPVLSPGFHRLTVHERAYWGASSNKGGPPPSWMTNVGLEYLELPQAHAVLPDHLRAGPLIPGVSKHLVVVVGRNFTSQTTCAVDGAAAPTRWLASNLIECEVAVTATAGAQVRVSLLERGLYFSRGDGLKITFTAPSYVLRVDPPQALLQQVSALVEVHIADPEKPEVGAPARAGYFCKFGDRAVRAQAVGPVLPLSSQEAARLVAEGRSLPATT